mmetsp:Transcript_23862/g.28152  ORF Transcript_23862/g.28152 Transcript_23862/m.28152 type:complete len:200 (-) Transcript_23862:210-809(-)
MLLEGNPSSSSSPSLLVVCRLEDRVILEYSANVSSFTPAGVVVLSNATSCSFLSPSPSSAALRALVFVPTRELSSSMISSSSASFLSFSCFWRDRDSSSNGKVIVSTSMPLSRAFSSSPPLHTLLPPRDILTVNPDVSLSRLSPLACSASLEMSLSLSVVDSDAILLVWSWSGGLAEVAWGIDTDDIPAPSEDGSIPWS